MSKVARIGVIGDFNPGSLSHTATNEAVGHACRYLEAHLEIHWVPTQAILAADSEKTLEMFDGLWCASGSPYKSVEGALRAIRFAREWNRPFIAT